MSRLVVEDFNILDEKAAKFDFMIPLRKSLKGVESAFQHPKYNICEAKALAMCCIECASIVGNKSSELDATGIDSKEKNRKLLPVQKSFDKCAQFISGYTQAGFLKHILEMACKEKKEDEDKVVSAIERELIEAVHSFCKGLDGMAVTVKSQNEVELDRIQKLLRFYGICSTTDPNEYSPEALAYVAKQAGCSTKDTLFIELIKFGFSEAKIDAAIDIVLNKALPTQESVNTSSTAKGSASGHATTNEESSNAVDSTAGSGASGYSTTNEASSNLDDSAGTSVASAGSVVSSTIGSAAAVIGEKLSEVDWPEVAGVTLEFLSATATAFPFMGPVMIATKALGNAIKAAAYNKAEALIIMKRCAESASLVADMAVKIDKFYTKEAEKIKILQPLQDTILKCEDFVKKFTSKGFLKYCMTVYNSATDKRTLSILDKEITDNIQILSVRISGVQMDLQHADSAKMDNLFLLIQNQGLNGNSSPSTLDPEVIAKIAKQAGCDTKEALSFELENIGLKLDEINNIVNNVWNLLQVMDRKLDNINDGIDDVKQRIDLHAQRQMKKEEEIVNMMREQHAQAMKQASVSLDKLKAIALKSGAKIEEKFSTKYQAERLARKAVELRQNDMNLNVIVLHSYGIGWDKYRRINGADGVRGTDGSAGRHGKSGGVAATGHGNDGEDGDDGDDGVDGGDGENGENADDFELTIEFISEDIEKGTHTFRIEHASPHDKEEDEVTINFSNTIFFVEGKGGIGGKGGDGGNGGHGGDGGNGGSGAAGHGRRNGGDGGSGGIGGRGGMSAFGAKGGHGADGAKVVIHTNYPQVLSIFEVDVSGGEAGDNGADGDVGRGGAAGRAGLGGEGGSYSEELNEGKSTRTVYLKAPSGKSGKEGKAGKNGKLQSRRLGKPPKAGKCGQVSFCIYDETGLKESGGTPCRVALDKNVLKSGLSPVSVVGMKSSKRDPVIFGEQVDLGPILPINIGSLWAPPSVFCGELHITSGLVTFSSKAMIPFPTIPAEDKTRFGELLPSNTQTLSILVPRISAANLRLDNTTWPLPKEASMPIKVEAELSAQFFVGNYPERSFSGEEHAVKVVYAVKIGMPIELVYIPGTQQACRVVASMAIDKYTSQPIKFSVLCPCQDLCCELKGYSYILRVAGEGFLPEMKSDSDSSAVPLLEFNGMIGELKYFGVGFKEAFSTLRPSSAKEIGYTIKLPQKNEVRLGARICMRAELWCDDVLFQYSALSYIRIAPPKPPSDGITNMDVMVFCHRIMDSTDYKVIERIAGLLRMRVYFLDYEHYSDRSSGKLDDFIWADQRGKVVVVWAPPANFNTNFVSDESIYTHLKQGGGLVCADQSLYKPHSDFNAIDSRVGRKIVYSSKTLNLTNLKENYSDSNGSLTGGHAVIFALNILSTFSVKQLLLYLSDQVKSNGNLKIGNFELNFFQSVVKAGCCGFGSYSAIHPVSKTSLTLRDCVLILLRTGLSADLETFEKSNNYSLCVSLEDFMTYANTVVITKADAEMARDMAAVAAAVDLCNPNLFRTLLGNKASKSWKKTYQPQIFSVINHLELISERANLDYKCLAERISDAIICGFGLKRRHQNQVDLAGGSMMHSATLSK